MLLLLLTTTTIWAHNDGCLTHPYRAGTCCRSTVEYDILRCSGKPFSGCTCRMIGWLEEAISIRKTLMWYWNCIERKKLRTYYKSMYNGVYLWLCILTAVHTTVYHSHQHHSTKNNSKTTHLDAGPRDRMLSSLSAGKWPLQPLSALNTLRSVPCFTGHSLLGRMLSLTHRIQNFPTLIS